LKLSRTKHGADNDTFTETCLNVFRHLSKLLKKPGVKIGLLALTVLAVGLLVHVGPLHPLVADLQTLKSRLQEAGVWAPLLLIGITAFFVAIGFPRLVFCAVAGTVFGFARGLLWSQLGALAGAYACFLTVRWGGQEWFARRISRHERLESLFAHPSVLVVFLMRQLPVTSAVISSVLALTSVSHHVFLVGSFLGFLPGAVAVTLVSSGLTNASVRESLLEVSAAVLCVLLTAVGLRRLYRVRAGSIVHLSTTEPPSRTRAGSIDSSSSAQPGGPGSF